MGAGMSFFALPVGRIIAGGALLYADVPILDDSLSGIQRAHFSVFDYEVVCLHVAIPSGSDESATVEVEDEEVSVSIASTGQDSMIRIQTEKNCTTAFVIKDGPNEYRYSLEIYEDDTGHSQILITPEE